MINKFFKIIHNKYSKFFRFIFFLRYLFIIFLVSITLFLTLPIFFDYKKNEETFKKHLLKNYSLAINDYDEIEFNSLPAPNIEIKNVSIELENSYSMFYVKSLKVYPKLFSIYNYKNFQSNKIILDENTIILEIKIFKKFIKKLFKEKNNIFFNNSNLKIVNTDKTIIDFKKIKFANYGYNKNLITGEIFKKKFKVKLNNNLKNIKFELPSSGINLNLDLDSDQRENLMSGILKSKILNTNLKFNFELTEKYLKIYDSFFRSKYFTFNNQSLISYQPYFMVNSTINIEEFNSKIFKKLNFKEFIKFKDVIKKINSQNQLNFNSKKFSRNLIDELNMQVNLAYGRVNYFKKFLIANNLFKCKGTINLLEEYPLLFFNCEITLNDSHKLFKKFSIKTKNKTKINNMYIIGNLNIFNNKINFKKISVDNNYEASTEDLRYLKTSFENILFDESFLKIFDTKKLAKFFSEVL